MTLGERMLQYRAKHKISQRQLAELLGEKYINTIHRIEYNKHKLHKINEIRLTEKMDKLEEEERKKK